MDIHKFCHFLVISTLFLTQTVIGQSLNLVQLATLPSAVKETSGIDQNGTDHIWTHNDSGDGPNLYKISTTGVLLKTVSIPNASNVDWEDLARDDKGNFYVGDCGNNGNTRTDFQIYKIPNPDSISGNQVMADTIRFDFSDQQLFPPPFNERHYDIEAFFWFEDSLYLFSKNRTDPYDGTVRMYRLPDTPGTFDAVAVDTLLLGGNDMTTWWVTGADVSEDGTLMALVSTDKMWLFSCYEGDDFFGGLVRRFNFPAPSQKEAICFAGPDQVYVTDEEVIVGPFTIGRSLYAANLGKYANGLVVELGDTLTTLLDSIVLDAGNAGAHYLWSTGDTTRQLVVKDSGIYSVAVRLGPCSQSDTVSVSFLTTGLEEFKIDHPDLKISPNPFGTETRLSFVIPQPGDVLFEVFDTTGSMVTRLNLRYMPAGPINFRLTDNNLYFSPGTYILKVSSGSWHAERKIMKVQ